VISGIRRALDFQGRSSIAEAWIFHVCVVVTAVVLAIGNSVALEAMPVDAVNYLFLGLFCLLIVATAIPYASLFVRRLHDVGLSGWWALAVLVPFLGGLLIIPVFLIPGRREPNRFGPAPGASEPAVAPEPPPVA